MLKQLIDPDPNLVGESYAEFLKYLAEPTCIFLTGEDSSRCRAVVTLQHGNEPSGLMAIHRWIRSGKKPAVNALFIIASVAAAQAEPIFSQRFLPGKRDLNRCFKEPYSDEQGKLAKAILACIERYQPEAVIDMHNTSGSGPAFGVAIFEDKLHDQLTSIFADKLIVTHLQLGALMEISEFLCPTVTIELGGREDEAAHQLAYEGLSTYLLQKTVLGDEEVNHLQILRNPVRLELLPEVSIDYGDALIESVDLTLLANFEELNSVGNPGNTLLGYTSKTTLEELFVAKNSSEQCVLRKMLSLKDGKLITNSDLNIFMATNSPDIAKSDCLLYAVDADGAEISP